MVGVRIPQQNALLSLNWQMKTWNRHLKKSLATYFEQLTFDELEFWKLTTCFFGGKMFVQTANELAAKEQRAYHASMKL